MKPLPLLEQRKIEAGVLIPLIRDFQEEFGEENTNRVVRRVISQLAQETGRTIGEESDESPIEKVAALIPRFDEGDALELEVVREDGEHYDFNVTRCRFAEFYKSLGVPELGLLLSCARDFALTSGISDDLKLERTQTIMEGAAHCDFRFRAAPPTDEKPDEDQ